MDPLYGERGWLSKGKGGPGNRAAHAHRAREWEECALQRHLSFHRHSEFTTSSGAEAAKVPISLVRLPDKSSSWTVVDCSRWVWPMGKSSRRSLSEPPVLKLAAGALVHPLW